MVKNLFRKALLKARRVGRKVYRASRFLLLIFPGAIEIDESAISFSTKVYRKKPTPGML